MINDFNMFSKYNIILYSLCILFLSGCNIGQKYQRPDIDLPDHYRANDSLAVIDTSNIESLGWRSIFKDTLLIRLIEDGLERNFDVRNAIINIEIANRQLFQSKFLYFPEIDLQLLGTDYNYRSKNFRSSPSAKWYEDKGKEAPDNMFLYTSEVTSGITASWEIDFWQKFKNQKESDLADFLGTMESKRAIENRLISSIAKAYFNLVQLNAQIEVAKTNAALSDSTLKMIELQFKAGEITRLALQQTEAQRLLALSLVPELEQEIVIQENILQTLTSRYPSKVDISKNLREIVELDSLIDIGTPIDLLRNRPDVRNAEFQLISANAAMNIQKALRYPTLTLGGRLGLNSMLPENWFNIPGSLFGSFTAGLTAPIFKRRKLKTEYEIASLKREQAELDLYKSIYESVAEVSNALVQVDKQKSRLEYAERRVTNAESAVENANLLFRSGYATYLEVITAQSNALQSNLDRINVQHKQYNAIIDLYSALGASW